MKVDTGFPAGREGFVDELFSPEELRGVRTQYSTLLSVSSNESG